MKGPGRYSRAKVPPRKSSPAGIRARLAARKAEKPPDTGKDHFITPGSLNPRKS